MIRTAPDKQMIIRQIEDLVPPGAPEPREPALLAQLSSLTSELIEAFKAQGMLGADPLASMRARRIPLYSAALETRLKDKVVLVTGGAGCVGQQLLATLRGFDLKRIVSVDIAYDESDPGNLDTSVHSSRERQYAADVRDFERMDAIFSAESPDIVFHLAAQRRPDLAELSIRDTFTTNVFGTENVISLCERHHVQNCVYASTGKCFIYFTSNVYAASKKLGEFQVARAAREKSTVYSIVRFTHILDNSLVNHEIEEGLAEGLVKLHGPERYLNVQNVYEAVHLLLNALALAKKDHQPRFMTVQNIGWPVSTLEIALYRIEHSQKDAAIYFLGVPKGYDAQFFKGQFDWSGETEIHPLINALESSSTRPDETGSMLTTETEPFCSEVLSAQLQVLHAVAEDKALSETQMKQELLGSLRAVVTSLFEFVPTSKLLHILNWGLNFRLVQAENTNFRLHIEIIRILLAELVFRIEQGDLLNSENADLYALVAITSPLMWWFHWRFVRHMTDKVLGQSTNVKAMHVSIGGELGSIAARLIQLTDEQRAHWDNFLEWTRANFGIEIADQELEALAALDETQLIDELNNRCLLNGLSVTPAALVNLCEMVIRGIGQRRALENEAETLESRLSDLITATYGLVAGEVDRMWARSRSKCASVPQVALADL
jgi:nucleoside-diphosphate-sugar epimerase